MEQVYNLKVLYTFGQVSSVNTELCKIEKISETSWLYRFESALRPQIEGLPETEFDWHEPILKVREYKNIVGGVTHLKFTILYWDGILPATIVWGSNEYPIWTEEELLYPLSLNEGEVKIIGINLIQKPVVPTWWDKLGVFGKRYFIVGGLSVVAILAAIALRARKKRISTEKSDIKD